MQQSRRWLAHRRGAVSNPYLATPKLDPARCTSSVCTHLPILVPISPGDPQIRGSSGSRPIARCPLTFLRQWIRVRRTSVAAVAAHRLGPPETVAEDSRVLHRLDAIPAAD